MKKYLRTIEYSPLGKIPKKEEKEFEFIYNNSIIRTKVFNNDSKTKIEESIDSYYNNSIIDSNVLCIDDVIIYDDININDNQELAYVFECPVCMYTSITSDKDMDFCPQCENTNFPLKLISLINIDQMNDIAINDKESTLIVVNDDKIEVFDKEEKED